MAPTRVWPGSLQERADQNTVVTLIEEVGRDRIRFTVADIRKRLEMSTRHTLHRSHELARHVAYLELPGTLLVRVGSRFSAISDSEVVPRSKHTFVLTSRMHEYEAGHARLELDDVERVRLALWVAHRVCGAPVPTIAVTLVLKNVLALALSVPRQTTVHLETLAGRRVPLAEKTKLAGQHGVRWRPLGIEPAIAEMDQWTLEVRPALKAPSALSAAGHATKGEIVREIVEIAVRSHKSSQWPAGRSVTITDIRATISDNARAGELHKHLVRIGGSLGVVLGDLCKETVDGRARVNQRVAKVSNPWTESTYYDAPMLDGFESRRLVVPMRGLATVFSAASLHDLNLERKKALALKGIDPALNAIVAARILHVQHELDKIGGELTSVRREASLLSTTERARLDEMIAKYNRMREAHGTTAEALVDAAACVAPYSLDPAEVLAVDRPLLTGSEYAAWFPSTTLRGRTAPEFLARAKSLRRYPNPAFVGRHDSDPVRASPTGVDRVDALVYAAQQRRSQMVGFLLSGAALLGRFLRDARLPALLLDSGDLHLRHQALAALALLGDDRACIVATDALAGAQPLVRQCDAIYALTVLRRFSAELVPGSARRTADLELLRLVVVAEEAATAGRWLLQR
jgi:hypothetical protein